MTGLVARFKQYLALTQKEMQIRNLAVGINSTVDLTKDMHIVMLDYDVDDAELVVKSIKELQAFWKLSDCEVFKTKNGFHAFFWYDHVPYGRLRMIIEFAKYVDPMYKYISRFYDHKTVRVAGKYDYKDIQRIGWLPGKRKPSKDEIEVGNLKRKERELLAQ